MSRRVLLLTSDTGGGHRSVAAALRLAAAERQEWQVELVEIDPFRPLPPALGAGPAERESPDLKPYDRLVRLYGPLILRAPWLWGWLFHLADNRAMLEAYLACFGPHVRGRIERAARAVDASAVVSVHPLVNHLMVQATERLGRARGGRGPRIPSMTVLTDLVDVHRWWVAPGIDQYVVPTDRAAGRLHRMGVPPSKIAVLGIPLRREFGTTAVSAREMRSRLGLDPDLSTVLLMGGGDGAGRLVATARAIGALAERGGPHRGGPPFQLVVLSGRNHHARIELEARRWAMPFHCTGYVSNIAEYMTAADVVVTKPGSLTVAEALAMGRPLLLGRPLPGQEEGNVPYVVEAGAGLAIRTPTEAADAVEYLLGDPATRWEMGQRAARVSRPRATERTLDLLQSHLLRAEAAGPVVALRQMAGEREARR
jgi:1,2-diacylglycerol 3-beta-galactosyltransferase